MSSTLTVRDETTSGQLLGRITLEFLTERITVRELIRSRVYQEVQDHNLKAHQHVFQGLVQPSDAERELNGYRLRKPRTIDWKQQYEVALKAFQENGFLILVGDRQVEDLDEEIEIQPGVEVTFLKLVPLVGG
ncbi:MAG TPA: hypothetical protein PKG54_14170 [Phycisphaerae bacterium]|jgi:hypothetical protein|nr:hypothetical protein [Phycisphaerae bacterium]HOB75659.1 hypothetical protein [Phycisphaerae bacterium]HOJ53271.1 hypothetical protein [Phycisphaerae bacterium]HOL27434.1 hypothetical protein [Phycisphaerae bacterium]HPP21630.1 hypothetical protein [Phycisphaerae bacterium]